MYHLDPHKTLPWLLYLVFFAVLNETMFNVSAPAVAAQFHLTPVGVSWLMTTFIVFFGVGSVVYGRLSDLFSLKRLIVIGTLIYAVGSVVGFVGQTSYEWVIAARALQGMGSAALPALIMVIVARYFEPEVRGRLFGSIGSVVAVALGVGPVLGGIVTGSWHWAWLFLIPLGTLAGLPFLMKVLPEEPRKPGTVDWLGALLMTGGLGSLLVWLSIPEWPWLAAGSALLVAFIVRILVAREPFVQPDLFTNRPFRRGVLTSLFLFGALIGVFFVLPLALHGLHGLSAETIGLVLFPGAISGVVFGPWGGRLADAKGNRFVLWWGLALSGGGLLATAAILSWSSWAVAATLLPAYIGFSFLQTALINSVSQTLPGEETGVGMGVFNLVGILAGAVGTAAVAKVLEGTPWGYAGVLVLWALVAVVAAGLYGLSLKRGR